MFGFLVRDENFEVVEVALAVVTPWSLGGCQYAVSRGFRWAFLASNFWFRSGYLLRFFVMTAVGSGWVERRELWLSRSSTSLEVKLQGSRFLES
jgi:hypothetical protein